MGEGALRQGTAAEEISRLCGERAENIYTARGYCCAEAVIVALEGAFRGGLGEETAARLGSGFCHGLGGAGCLCGALAGGEIIVALYLGPRGPGGLEKKAFQKEVARELHDRFRQRFAATCCRALLKRRKEQGGASCLALTVGAAEIAAALLLALRPALADRVDREFLALREEKER
jgi:C_GCAxxG_C_C family probable redox protein